MRAVMPVRTIFLNRCSFSTIVFLAKVFKAGGDWRADIQRCRLAECRRARAVLARVYFACIIQSDHSSAVSAIKQISLTKERRLPQFECGPSVWRRRDKMLLSTCLTLTWHNRHSAQLRLRSFNNVFCQQRKKSPQLHLCNKYIKSRPGCTHFWNVPVS